MTLALFVLSWFNWLLIAISTAVAAMVVDKLKCSNMMMIPIIAVVWLVCWIVVGILHIAWVLLPFIIIGIVVWVVLKKA